jgi:hypothetical protein
MVCTYIERTSDGAYWIGLECVGDESGIGNVISTGVPKIIVVLNNDSSPRIGGVKHRFMNRAEHRVTTHRSGSEAAIEFVWDVERRERLMVGVAARAHARWVIRKSLIFETTLLTPEVAEFQWTVATLLIALNSGGACCRGTCRATAVRIRSMMSGRVTSATTRKLPQRFGQKADGYQSIRWTI